MYDLKTVLLTDLNDLCCWDEVRTWNVGGHELSDSRLLLIECHSK